MATPTIDGFSQGTQTADTAYFDPAAVAVGSWMVVTVTWGNSSHGGTAPEGWTALLPNTWQTIGTRSFGVFAKIREASDGVAVWSGNATTYPRVRAVWGSGGAPVSEWTTGLTAVRQASNAVTGQSIQGGTGTTSVAPGITLSDFDSLVLAVTTEATTAQETDIVGVSGATDLWFSNRPTHEAIETVWYGQVTPFDGATGDVTVTYPNSQGSNGGGVQVAIPPADGPTDPNAGIYVMDTFTREIAEGVGNGWGTPDIGPTYFGPGGVSAVGMGVDGMHGVISKGTSSPRIHMQHTPVTDVSYQASFSHDKIPAGAGNLSQRMILRYVDDATDYHVRSWLRSDGTLGFRLARGDALYLGSEVQLGAYTPGRWYHVKGEVTGAAPTTVRFKAWWDGDPEPAEWAMERTDDSAGLQVAGYTGYRWVIGGGGIDNAPLTTLHDNFIVREPVEFVPAPESGNIATIASLNPSQTTLSVGVDRLAGGVAQVVLRNAGGAELDRATVPADEYGWGNATFTALAPDTLYRVTVEVDGVEQTDVELSVRTLAAGVKSFVAVAGSCQFTGSNHPTFDRIREEGAAFISHMGDLHYMDAETEPFWRSGMEVSLSAPRFRQMLSSTPMVWTSDNHDRIITNPAGAGTGLNLGETNPQTAVAWKNFAGATGYASSDTLGRTWTVGRVRFIQTDMWTVRDDADGDPAPRTFLGADQKQWFKDTLDAATEPLIIWFCSWTSRNHANGRWNSFPEESSELEAFINARPGLKARMVLVGGDSHSLQAGTGDYSGVSGYRFVGIPSLNISGFNRSSDSGDGSAGWDIANQTIRELGPEGNWGAYSRMTFTDDGATLGFRWEGVRVATDGATDVMATFEREYGEVPEGDFGAGWSFGAEHAGAAPAVPAAEGDFAAGWGFGAAHAAQAPALPTAGGGFESGWAFGAEHRGVASEVPSADGGFDAAWGFGAGHRGWSRRAAGHAAGWVFGAGYAAWDFDKPVVPAVRTLVGTAPRYTLDGYTQSRTLAGGVQ